MRGYYENILRASDYSMHCQSLSCSEVLSKDSYLEENIKLEISTVNYDLHNISFEIKHLFEIDEGL